MSVFLVMGVYRGLWRYTSMSDLIVFAKAVMLSSVGSILVLLFAFRFVGFSRKVFIIDAISMFLLLAGSRMAFRLFRQNRCNIRTTCSRTTNGCQAAGS